MMYRPQRFYNDYHSFEYETTANSMVQSAVEYTSSSVGRNISSVLWNPNFITILTRSATDLCPTSIDFGPHPID
jgi:hypothetical protein